MLSRDNKHNNLQINVGFPLANQDLRTYQEKIYPFYNHLLTQFYTIRFMFVGKKFHEPLPNEPPLNEFHVSPQIREDNFIQLSHLSLFVTNWTKIQINRSKSYF